MDYFNTPIFLIAYNRLTPLQRVVAWLESAGYQNLHIIDNASEYAPLLQWLADSPHTVHRMPENLGHLALWKSGQFQDIIDHQPFVLNDCDVLPDADCPADIVARLAAVLSRYPAFTKVGLSLRIDDLPDHYALKSQVLDWEARFWEHPLEDGQLYEAAIDTTFAYYRPGINPDDSRWWRSLRTAPPLTAQHLPWYDDTTQPSTEDLYYQSHLREMSSQWSTTDPAILKAQNIKLQMQLHALQKELTLLKQGFWPHTRACIRQSLVSASDQIGLGRLLRAVYHRFLKR